MNLNNIPYELKTLDQWVCTKGDSKLPMIPYTSDCASSVDPLTWSAFQKAVGSINYGKYDYVGFVFNNNGIVGILFLHPKNSANVAVIFNTLFL